MNCVISGNSGLAFVLDNGRALIVRADRPGQSEEVPLREFHRIFGDVTDRVFLEGVTLTEIKRRLTLACRASTALSLALLVLDASAPKDLRVEAAQELERLVDALEILGEVEKVLSAAPIPEYADVDGAEEVCRKASAKTVRSLLIRLASRQEQIRIVCAAWNALPARLFENEGRRRAARTVCVREGLFLAMVSHAEAGQRASSFLLEALVMPTMLRSFTRFRDVLRSWSAVLDQAALAENNADSIHYEEHVQPQDDEQTSLRRRGHSPSLPSSSVSPGARAEETSTAAPMSQAAIKDALKSVALFSTLTADEFNQLASTARSVTARKGGRIFEEGAPADCCYVLVSGQARVVIAGAADAELVLGIVRPMGLVGELGLMDQSPRSATLVASEVCQLIQVPAQSFELLRQNPQFERNVIAHVISSLLDDSHQVEAIASASTLGRLAWCLSRLARHEGQREGQAVTFPRRTHKELAEMIGCSRETVARKLELLKRRRCVSWDAHSMRVDVAGLERHVRAELPEPGAV